MLCPPGWLDGRDWLTLHVSIGCCTSRFSLISGTATRRCFALKGISDHDDCDDVVSWVVPILPPPDRGRRREFKDSRRRRWWWWWPLPIDNMDLTFLYTLAILLGILFVHHVVMNQLQLALLLVQSQYLPVPMIISAIVSKYMANRHCDWTLES